MQPLICFQDVTKEYIVGELRVRAVDHVSLEIEQGEFVVILGPSGAGKSTVLNLLGGMDTATSGSITVAGREITTLDERELTAFRRDQVGFVFQFYNLIPTLTALENVALIREIIKDALDAGQVLSSLGLGDRLNQFPAQLSGGEQQRVSIARALCKNPRLLLCDEPTGALDSETGVVILSLLEKMSRERGQTVVVVTHNSLLAPVADRVIRLRDGKVSDHYRNQAPKSVKELTW